jgi:hypothetical protein
MERWKKYKNGKDGKSIKMDTLRWKKYYVRAPHETRPLSYRMISRAFKQRKLNPESCHYLSRNDGSRVGDIVDNKVLQNRVRRAHTNWKRV